MMNLAEQLLLTAVEMNGLHDFQTRDLLTQAADTIEAQSRLLALADGLSGAIGETESSGKHVSSAIHAAFITYEAALSKYQTTGTVPCGECDAAHTALIEWINRFEAVEHERDQARATCDDLRRQLEGRDEERLRLVTEKAEALNEAKGLRRRLAEAQKHNKALADDVAAWNQAEAYRSEKENGIIESQQAHIERLTSDNAALIEALEKIRRCKWPKEFVGWTTMDCERLNWALDVADAALGNQPHPGAPLLEELAALRKVEKAGRELGDYNADTDFFNACAELDAIRNRESRHE